MIKRICAKCYRVFMPKQVLGISLKTRLCPECEEKEKFRNGVGR
jgi:RNase P subunit RPR2